MVKSLVKFLRQCWQSEPLTILFGAFLLFLHAAIRLGPPVSFYYSWLLVFFPPDLLEILLTMIISVFFSPDFSDLLLTVVIILILGVFIEGCLPWQKKALVFVSGAFGGCIGAYISPGFYSGAPVFCGMIGSNITAPSFFRKSLDLNSLLGLLSLFLPLLFRVEALADPGRLRETLPLLSGLIAGVFLERILAGTAALQSWKFGHITRAVLEVPSREDLRMVHISDLHECWDGGAWDSVRNYVRQIGPHLVIVSGDLIDTPRRKALDDARDRLQSLDVPVVLVLPGNHDFLSFGTLFTLPGAANLFFRYFPIRHVVEKRLNIVSLDSNANPWLATARVRDIEIRKAKEEFERIRLSPVAVRLVALHHHVIPLPYAPDRGITNQDIFLILRNSGSFLAGMHEADVDLVLHGHRHKAAFVRLTDLSFFDARETPITILSAGSSTLGGQGGANLNVIKIRPNGSVVVQRYFYPPGLDRAQADPESELFTYSELKQRFFRRYRWAQGLEIKSVKVEVHIDEYGSAEHFRKIEGLKCNTERPKRIVVNVESERGTLGPLTTTWQSPSGVEQQLDFREQDGTSGRYAIELPDAVYGNPGADLAISYVVHFAYSRTAAEALRSACPDPLKQSLSFFIRYPIQELVLTLKLKPKFSTSNLAPRVYYYPEVIASALTDERELPDSDSSKPIEDHNAEQLEPQNLDRVDDAWQLKIAYPMVGYEYALEWNLEKTPPDTETESINARTDAVCRDLLHLKEEGFDQLRLAMQAILKNFMIEFFPSRMESIFMEIYVPDPDEKFRLKCIAFATEGTQGYQLGWRPPTIKPGQGLVGAAFRLAQPVGYVHGTSQESYYVELPGSPKYMVAIAVPFFHEDAEAAAKRGKQFILEVVGPIAVIFLGSTEKASYLRYFGLPDPPQGATGHETDKRKVVTSWIMERLQELFVELVKVAY